MTSTSASPQIRHASMRGKCLSKRMALRFERMIPFALGLSHLDRRLSEVGLVSFIFSSLLLMFSSSTGLCAQDQAAMSGADPRLIELEFDEQQSYLILTRPKSVTLIQMAAEESIVTAVAGDTVNFSVVVSQSRNYVMVRPKYEGLTTSLTLITNFRHYPLTLRSTKEAVGKWYQRVQWNYPKGLQEEEQAELLQMHARVHTPHEGHVRASQFSYKEDTSKVERNSLDLSRLKTKEQKTALSAQEASTSLTLEGSSSAKVNEGLPLSTREAPFAGTTVGPSMSPAMNPAMNPSAGPASLKEQAFWVDVSLLNTKYTIQGEATFKPLVVFDDGIRTYFKMPRTLQSMPALFAFEEGKTQLVNYTVRQDHLVAQGLHSGFVLKLSDKEVRVLGTPEESSGFWGKFKP